MTKWICLALATTIGAAKLALLPANPPVELQPALPGVTQDGHINISGTAIVGVLRSQGTVFGQSTATTGYAYGGFFTTASNQGRGFYGYASATSGLTYGGFFQNASSQGRAVYGLATGTTADNFGGYFQAAGSSGRGVLGVAASPTGTTYGVYGTAVSPNGYGVYSNGNMAATGVISGDGSGLANLNAVAIASGTLASARLPVPMTLTGTVGGGSALSVTNATTNGRAITGSASALTGVTFGVRGESNSAIGIGVYGLASSASGANYGGKFETPSESGRGSYGLASANSGSTAGVFGESASTTGKGVFGLANKSGPTDTPYGVYGQASTATNGYGLYALGDSGASGTKAFRIDHPLEPAGKYLLHYASESPFPQNFYNGNVTTDATGYAWVNLPEYFAEINTNFKYTLTIVDDADRAGFAQAKVSKKIRGNRFQIRTSLPNVDVSWEVKADRNDLRVRANRPSDVRVKAGLERGTYQHPEYYGLGPEWGVNYPLEDVGAQRHARPPSVGPAKSQK